MLGPQHCEVLPFFHAFTGCDLVSPMLGIGKKTAWNSWNAYPIGHQHLCRNNPRSEQYHTRLAAYAMS